MPNYVKNELLIVGDDKDLNALAELVKSEHTVFSFDRIVPMPKTMYIPCSSLTDTAYDAVCGNPEAMERLKKRFGNAKSASADQSYLFDERFPGSNTPKTLEDALFLGKVVQENLQKYGKKNWYDWSIENWGTKWNAGEASMTRGNMSSGEHSGKTALVYRFDTAWSAPLPILLALQRKFPVLLFVLAWADEDTGYNCGRVQTFVGKTDSWDIYEPEEGSEEAIKFAEAVWDDTFWNESNIAMISKSSEKESAENVQ